MVGSNAPRIDMDDVRRRPLWSDVLTQPIARRVPERHRPTAVRAIRSVHTAAFALIAGCILVFTWDAIRGRGGKRSQVAAGIAITETVIYGSNNQVCPLTPLAEELGAESGTVTDIYLPRAVSVRIPLLGGSALALGLVFEVARRVGRRSG
jgi:hypothetical protein